MQMDDWLARPLEEVIPNIATAVAEGQRRLDEYAMDTQRELEAAADRGELDYYVDAPWYRFAGVDVDVKLSVLLNGRQVTDEDGRVRGYKPTVMALPMNPRVREELEYDAEMVSDVELHIVPVPKERAVDER